MPMRVSKAILDRVDFSTLDIDKVRSLGVYNEPLTYHLSDTMGQGCAFDPPGYPTYFLRSVYTRHGNSPSKGTNTVITLPTLTSYKIPEFEFWNEEGQSKFRRLLSKLWIPLSLDHPRTEAWIQYCHAYFQGSYSPDGVETKVQNLVSEGNPEFHKAYLHVKRYYPDYEPDLDLIENPPVRGKGGVGSWWEYLPYKPSPEECIGGSIGRHPVNHSWCQVCGWHE